MFTLHTEYQQKCNNIYQNYSNFTNTAIITSPPYMLLGIVNLLPT